MTNKGWVLTNNLIFEILNLKQNLFHGHSSLGALNIGTVITDSISNISIGAIIILVFG